ncbi:MAG: anhydro-N-acetylmuramic acid kinase [Alphaproteobacteria bacterium]
MFHAIGLMSGTSLDGIDAALIATDGLKAVKPLGFVTLPYRPEFRQKLRECFGNQAGNNDPHVAAIETELTTLHAAAVDILLKRARRAPETIDMIGFHGQTLWHRPREKRTCQIGDGALLAKLTRIPVVNDFRSADVAAGGQGAPFVPLYHAARAATMPKPLAILNIGGVANITWLERHQERGEEILAFDTGPGVALLDDWMLRHTGIPYDADGKTAAQGKADWASVVHILARPHFALPAPKSLDRNEFHDLDLGQLSPEDGAATLAMVTAAAVARGFQLIDKKPLMLLVTGGGRHHPPMMRWIAELADCPALPVEAVGWNGDALEAEAFAYLAVRHWLDLPLSLPRTTGVPEPMRGGVLHRP